MLDESSNDMPDFLIKIKHWVVFSWVPVKIKLNFKVHGALIPELEFMWSSDYLIISTWKIVSSFQWGLILESSTAILLCSLTNRRWTIARTVCSLTLNKNVRVLFFKMARQNKDKDKKWQYLLSPAKKQKTSSWGLKLMFDLFLKV